MTHEQKQDEKKSVPEPDMNFTRELREATKDAHKISDALFNAKFVFALSDDAVWADGLLAFYELFKFFETHLPEELLPTELHRTEAFEKDLAYFLGDNWKKKYEPRQSVKNYLKHLEEVKAKNIILLFAFAYQMYMELMSGGQMYQKKRMIARKLLLLAKKKNEQPKQKQPKGERKRLIENDDVVEGDLQSRPMPIQVTICPEGCATTFFPESITDLKAKLRAIFNTNYGKLDEQMRENFIKESRDVFLYNNEVIKSIKGVNRAYLRKFVMLLVILIGIYFAWIFAGR